MFGIALNRRQFARGLDAPDEGVGATDEARSKARARATATAGAGLAPWTAAPGAGMFAGTQVATALGWRDVETISPGDRVLTFDSGMREVVVVRRIELWSSVVGCPCALKPVEIPAGAFGNLETLRLLPEQGVLTESDLAEAILGDPFVIVPAAALAGCRGVRRVAPAARERILMLEFAEDQIVYANRAGLLYCPSRDGVIRSLLDDNAPYPMASFDVALAIAADLAADQTITLQ